MLRSLTGDLVDDCSIKRRDQTGRAQQRHSACATGSLSGYDGPAAHPRCTTAGVLDPPFGQGLGGWNVSDSTYDRLHLRAALRGPSEENVYVTP